MKQVSKQNFPFIYNLAVKISIDHEIKEIKKITVFILKYKKKSENINVAADKDGRL